MTFKDLVSKAAVFVSSKVKNIASMVVNTKLENIVKASLFIGGSIYSAYVLISNLIEKRRVHKSKANKNTVDEALDLNYSDRRKRNNLNNLFVDIDDAFKGKPKRRKKFKKLSKDDIDELERIHDRLVNLVPTFTDDGGTYLSHINDDLKIFQKQMKEVKRLDKLRDVDEDEYEFWRIWRSPAY